MKLLGFSLIIALTSCYNIHDNQISDGEIRTMDMEGPENTDEDEMVENTIDWDAYLQPEEITDYDTEVHYYSFSEDWKDSSLKCIRKMKEGANIHEPGGCYERFPAECEWADNHLIERGENEDQIESFDSLMCEVGGNSAYDKYIFKRNSSGQVVEVKHYEAWFEHYDYDEETGEEKYWNDYTPDWDIGHITTLDYGDKWRLLETVNKEGEVYYRIKDHYEGDALRMQEITRFGDNFKAYYVEK